MKNRWYSREGIPSTTQLSKLEELFDSGYRLHNNHYREYYLNDGPSFIGVLSKGSDTWYFGLDGSILNVQEGRL